MADFVPRYLPKNMPDSSELCIVNVKGDAKKFLNSLAKGVVKSLNENGRFLMYVPKEYQEMFIDHPKKYEKAIFKELSESLKKKGFCTAGVLDSGDVLYLYKMPEADRYSAILVGSDWRHNIVDSVGDMKSRIEEYFENGNFKVIKEPDKDV